MTRPGVYVSENTLSSVVSNPSTSSAMGGFIGTALRGPSTPVLVQSWSDFTSKFGTFSDQATLPDALYQFFNNGGTNAYVARVLASDAVASEGTFDSRLLFDSIYKGAWGNGITVDVTLNSDAETFTLAVREYIRGTNVVVERFRDLSMDSASPRYVESVINSTTIGSSYIQVSDLDKDDTVLGTGGSVSLSGGADGSNSISASDYSTILDGFDEIAYNFVFNCPGLADVSAVLSKIEGPNGRQDSILVVDTAENQTPDMSGASLPTSGYAAVYYPWIYISDPSPTATRGAIKKVPPGASVVGMIIRTDVSRGVYKAPAGVASTLTGVVANELRITNTQLDALAGMNVNVIRPVSGAGIAVMGARTRTFGTTDQYISVRRTINYVKKRAVEVSRFALFEPNLPTLWEQLRVANGAFLSELFNIGGLSGSSYAEAFYVKCDGDNNTAATISNGEVNIEIGIAPAFPSEFVVIKIGQFESDASTITTEEV